MVCHTLNLLCAGVGVTLTLTAAPPPSLEITHDTSPIPERALAALEMDPLGIFAGVDPDERINVGLRVDLQLCAPGVISNVQWTVPGSVIKSYAITSAVDYGQGFLTDCSTTALSASDLQSTSISYYYTEPGLSQVTASALVDNAPMEASITFDVRRNPKAEIFYASGPGTNVIGVFPCPVPGLPADTDVNNDGMTDYQDFLLYQSAFGQAADPAGTTLGIIGEHAFRHEIISTDFGGETEGDEFFRFHRGFIQKFDCWRGIFGYPCLKVYATAPEYLPSGDDFDHAGVPGDSNGIIQEERHPALGAIEELEAKFTIDGDGIVGAPDLLIVVTAWGTDPGGPPDFDGDGDVGITDWMVVVDAWGPLP